MTGFEHQLRQALRPVEPSPDFTRRVFERAGRPPVRSPFPPARWLAAAALVAVTLGAAGGWGHQRRERRVQAERAQAQLRLALEISSENLNNVLKKLQTEQEN